MALRVRLIKCSNVLVAEVLDRNVAGLKPTTQDWVLIYDPTIVHLLTKWSEVRQHVLLNVTYGSIKLSPTQGW